MVTASEHTLEEIQEENVHLRNEITYLKEQIEWFKKQIFGQKSEKIITLTNEEQLEFEGIESSAETYKEEATEIGPYKRKKPNRNGQDAISYPDSLPVECHVIDIPEEKKFCPETGKPIKRIGEEVTRKLAHVPCRFYIKEYVRPKYACPLHPEEKVQYANSILDGIIRKSPVDESLFADIIVKKYADHIPHYRISEGLRRCGIHISRKLLSHWTVKIGEILKPLHKIMHEEVLASGNLFIDESTVKMQVPG